MGRIFFSLCVNCSRTPEESEVWEASGEALRFVARISPQSFLPLICTYSGTPPYSHPINTATLFWKLFLKGVYKNIQAWRRKCLFDSGQDHESLLNNGSRDSWLSISDGPPYYHYNLIFAGDSLLIFNEILIYWYFFKQNEHCFVPSHVCQYIQPE